MSTGDGSNGADEAEGIDVGETDEDGVRERLGGGADRAVERFDDGVVDLLSWILDTETRARIYVYLRQHPESTSDEVAEGTGLYPSTVREALAELHAEEKVQRGKRESGGAGNNPYEYTAIPPSELVTDIVGDVQSELNTVFNLDHHLRGDEEETVDVPDEEETVDVPDEDSGPAEPVTITVDEETDPD